MYIFQIPVTAPNTDSAASVFTYTHGLGNIFGLLPIIVPTSAGRIAWQTPLAYDMNYFYLTASGAGVTAVIEIVGSNTNYMGYGIPKIVWPSGGVNTLQFYYPSRKISPYNREVARTIEYSMYGLDQAVVMRTDYFIEFDMPAITIISSNQDLVNWENFLTYAAYGGHFDYYPDSNEPFYITCHEMEAKMKIEYSSPGIYRLGNINWREIVR